jgi:hypothetical protein
MPKRKSLAELMSEGGAVVVETDIQATGAPDSISDRLDPITDDPSTPKYLRLNRKEARLRDDQFEALTNLRRRLNRLRRGRGERITDNTLIRVAVDLLLLKRETLRGHSEEELLESLTRGR